MQSHLRIPSPFGPALPSRHSPETLVIRPVLTSPPRGGGRVGWPLVTGLPIGGAAPDGLGDTPGRDGSPETDGTPAVAAAFDTGDDGGAGTAAVPKRRPAGAVDPAAPGAGAAGPSPTLSASTVAPSVTVSTPEPTATKRRRKRLTRRAAVAGPRQPLRRRGSGGYRRAFSRTRVGRRTSMHRPRALRPRALRAGAQRGGRRDESGAARRRSPARPCPRPSHWDRSFAGRPLHPVPSVQSRLAVVIAILDQHHEQRPGSHDAERNGHQRVLMRLRRVNLRIHPRTHPRG